MNVHEYQGKEILASYGVRIQRGHVANNAEESVEKAESAEKESFEEDESFFTWIKSLFACKIHLINYLKQMQKKPLLKMPLLKKPMEMLLKK